MKNNKVIGVKFNAGWTPCFYTHNSECPFQTANPKTCRYCSYKCIFVRICYGFCLAPKKKMSSASECALEVSDTDP